MINLSICIPTHFRSDQLRLCLEALLPQLKPDDEILIGLTTSDFESLQVVNSLLNAFKCKTNIIFENQASLIAKLNNLAFNATKEWIVTTDDDAVPLENWLQKMREGLAEPGLGALGGRDIQEGVTQQTSKVGTVSFTGRVYGNHEKISNNKISVKFLKGVNFAIRKSLFPISEKMVLRGAEPHYEIYLCRKAARSNLKVKYDPNIVVLHYPGPRYDVKRNSNGLLAYVYNRNLVLAFGLNKEYLLLFRILLYQFVIGRSPSYGISRMLFSVKNFSKSKTIWFKANRGIYDGLKILFAPKGNK